MRTRVALVELPVFSGVVPLVSGYMEAVCRKDPILNASYSFEKLSLPVRTPFEDVLARLEEGKASVYAFSCYVWNSGLVRRLLSALLDARPDAQFILGGPQVMRQASAYLSPQHENVVVCNGEGERTFANYLRALLVPGGDLFGVHGLSFYRNGSLFTTEPEARISDLSEIPSPFLEGIFDKDRYTWMLIETNRGCPFKCNYCFWGAATGAKVFRYDDERVKRELTWISQSGCWYLFIADANWGMLKRDVDLSRLIADGRAQFGAPISVYFCSSKNTPDRVAEITRIFDESGLISCHSVALQTMSQQALKAVNRENIRTSAYTSLQTSLNEQGISSFVEMIWPLPGETLESFRRGLANLCELGADSFIVYPLLLMNNVELAAKREEYGLVTIHDPDPNSEAEIVIQTKDVDSSAYRDGMRYVYSVYSLHALRGLWCLSRYLNSEQILSYDQLFQRFVEFGLSHPDNPWTRFCEESIRRLETAAFSNIGELVHLILHAERKAFDELLADFVTSQDFWKDPVAQLLFEVDLVNRPYIYKNTPITQRPFAFRRLRVCATSEGYSVGMPANLDVKVGAYLRLSDEEPYREFEVRHRRGQLPFMPRKPKHELFLYCQDSVQRMSALAAVWKQASSVAA